MSGRVIRKEEEDKERSLRMKLPLETMRAMKTPSSMTHAQLSRNQKIMELKMANERDEQGRRSPPAPNFKQLGKILLNSGKKRWKSLRSLWRTEKPLVIDGVTPPNSKGGHNSRKYKYTNITKKPAKPKILAKKPAKPKI